MKTKIAKHSISFGLLLGVMAMLSSCSMTSQENSNAADTNKELISSNNQNGQPQVVRTSYMAFDPNANFVEAAEKSVNSVVHIKTEIVRKGASYNSFFEQWLEYLYGELPDNTEVAYGSGVVISPDGYIVTNNHVVDGADNVEVTFNNNSTKTAVIVGTDPTSDLALIKVDGHDFECLVFGDSDNVRVGEWVLAVGNPFNLTSTVTAGIVSAKARNLGILGDGTSVESFIQTDAVVNRGNSGGALVNTNGELIGINAAIASHTGVYEGYSFAIPSNIVRKVVDDILMYGQTQRAYLGVQVADMNNELAERVGINNVRGVYVANVIEGGGADMAGIKAGDVITAINGNKISTLVQLTEVINQYRPGNTVNVNLISNKQEKTVSVTLRNEHGTTEVTHQEANFYDSELGATLRPINSNERNTYGLQQGLVVIDIKQGVLKRAGINKGFVISSVNNNKVNSQSDLDKSKSQNRNGRVAISGNYPNGMKLSFEYYQ